MKKPVVALPIVIAFLMVVFFSNGNSFAGAPGSATALFSVSDSIAMAPAIIQFTDQSAGTFTKRIWNFGDGLQDSLAQNPAHVYMAANTYTVRLIVSGPAGADTATKQIFIYNGGDNPICIAGTYLSSQKVQITFTSYDTITPPSPFLTADSVGLWYKVGALPTAPGQSTFIKWYIPSVLRSRGSQYVDTLTLPALTGSDSVYGVMNGILWSDKTISNFMTGNGTLVLMRDTLPIVNDLIISGVYVPNDTAIVNLDNVQTIDTSRVDTVGIWYSLTGDTLPNFADKNYTRWLSAKEVLQAGTRYRFTIINAQFNNTQKMVCAAVICIGKNDRKSPVKKSSFIVGKPRPINPIHLAAKTISSTRIMLSWNNIAGSGVERVIIWYRPFQPVPIAYDVSTLGLDSLVPSVTDTVFVADHLLEMARYYFGAQVYKGGLWSYITDSASATDSTPPACCGLDSNGVPVLIPYEPKITMERRPLLQWHHVDSASTYTIVIDDNADFSSPIALLPLSDTAFKVAANLSFGTIYWKVKSDRSAIWSKVDYFTVQPDSVPFLVRYNGSAVVAARPRFTWYSVKNAVDYKIEIADNTGFTNATSLQVSDTSFATLANLKNGMWYWRVSCSRNYALFAAVDSVKVEASGIIRRAALVVPFISLTKSDQGYLISFGGYNRGEVSAVIYSVKGQSIAEIKAADFGRNAMLWDFKDRCGKHVTNGLYLMEIKAGSKIIKQKIIVTR